MSKTDIQIAREANMKPIQEILDGVGVPDNAEAYSPISRYIAKIKLEYLEKFKNKKDGKLILVTAITPTPAGEGKTTTSVGLSDGLNREKIYCLFKRAELRSFIWNEGWRSWWWLCTSCSYGTNKSSFHR